MLPSWRGLYAQVQLPQSSDPAMEALATGFTSSSAQVNGVTLHYVRGGQGPAVVLIHGFPQDWFEYHAIMPRLAKQFTVIAVDLRGIGGSTATPGGYDAANMAQDVHQLAAALKLDRVYIVGHDIGGHVAYAFVRRYPEATRGAMILDTPIPGVAGWDEILGDPQVWHIRFMQAPGLAEKLVAGRQADYFGYFFHFGKFTPSEEAHFVQAYASFTRYLKCTVRSPRMRNSTRRNADQMTCRCWWAPETAHLLRSWSPRWQEVFEPTDALTLRPD
jgi:pimeloyl-ACP methyl ester carboxylesterase